MRQIESMIRWAWTTRWVGRRVDHHIPLCRTWSLFVGSAGALNCRGWWWWRGRERAGSRWTPQRSSPDLWPSNRWPISTSWRPGRAEWALDTPGPSRLLSCRLFDRLWSRFDWRIFSLNKFIIKKEWNEMNRRENHSLANWGRPRWRRVMWSSGSHWANS